MNTNSVTFRRFIACNGLLLLTSFFFLASCYGCIVLFYPWARGYINTTVLSLGIMVLLIVAYFLLRVSVTLVGCVTTLYKRLNNRG